MSRLCQLVCLIVLSVVVGCGGYKPASGVTVKGKVTKGGVPLTVPNMAAKVGSVKIDLFPVHSDPQDERDAPGTLGGTDGSFEIAGGGKGIKPGKYKLSVVADPGDGQDQLGGKFAGQNSPIEVDISDKNLGGAQDLGTIDLDAVKK